MWCRIQLGELAHESKQTQALGVRVVAVSADERADAATMAKKYDIGFLLIPQPDNQLARAFGVLDEETEIPKPSMFLIDKTGIVRWRYLSSGTTDRIYTRELLSQLGGVVGRTTATPRGGYLPSERRDVQLGAVAGALFDPGDSAFEPRIALMALWPVARYVALGADSQYAFGDAARFQAQAVARLRGFYYADLGSVFLDLRGGIAAFTANEVRGDIGATGEVAIGTQFAVWPSLGFATEATWSALRVGQRWRSGLAGRFAVVWMY